MQIIEILYKQTIGRIVRFINDIIKNNIEYIICLGCLMGFIFIKLIDKILHNIYYRIGLSCTRDYEKDDCRNSYPIVMVHGFLGCENDSDSVLGLNYWNVINRKRKLDYDPYGKVYTVRVPPCASDRKRALYLSRLLCAFFYDQEEGVHLVGHSQGASTIRYMINHMKPRNYKKDSCGKNVEYRDFVKSITTINGSCKGCFIMDMFFDKTPDKCFRKDAKTNATKLRQSWIARYTLRATKMYDKLTNIFPVLKTTLYDLKWGPDFVRSDQIFKVIDDEIVRGDRPLDEIFGKYCEPDRMEGLYRSKDHEYAEYVANSKDSYPCDSVMTCNNGEQMYTYCKIGRCKCYDNLPSLHCINDIVCECPREEDNIKYVHVIGNIRSSRGFTALLPTIFPVRVGLHDGVISGYSQMGYCGMERILRDRKIFIKMDTINYNALISKDPTDNGFRVMEVANLDMLHYLAQDDKIKVVCIGMEGFSHFNIIFPHMPFTYKRISNLLCSLIKYVRHIEC